MPTYTVTNLIGNVAGDQPRNEVQWYKGTDLAQAISALVQSACHGRDGSDAGLPDTMRFRVHSVHLDITHDEPEPTTYKPTHVSAEDGSDAMLIAQRGDDLVLMNEDGHTWTDPDTDWVPMHTYADEQTSAQQEGPTCSADDHPSNLTVPYCCDNPGGCALHYPSEYVGTDVLGTCNTSGHVRAPHIKHACVNWTAVEFNIPVQD